MHELSIAMSIVEFAEEEAAQRSARVDAIHVKLGVLCGVVRHALLSAYDLARENTSLSEARLVIEDVPAMMFCSACGTHRVIEEAQGFCCPQCGQPPSEIVGGRQLEVIGLELLP